MLNPDNFMVKIGDKWAYHERWFDRCIDRYDKYIPSYPYFKPDLYTPESWVKEGKDLIQHDYHPNLVKRVVDFAIRYGFSCVSSSYDEDVEGFHQPKEEAGWTVYSISEFLEMEHEKEQYEGYVYYGRSIVLFDTNDEESFRSMVHSFINKT